MKTKILIEKGRKAIESRKKAWITRRKNYTPEQIAAQSRLGPLAREAKKKRNLSYPQVG